MIRSLLILFLLIPIKSIARDSPNSDSLLLVKNYLLDIQRVINEKVTEQERLGALDSLLQRASVQKTRLEYNLNLIVKNGQIAGEMTAVFNFIIQSLILYKTDLRNKSENTSEMEYLNHNIPILVDKIYYYCSAAH